VFADHTPIRDDLRYDSSTYAYLLISTMLVFTLLGWMIGRYADRLAELSQTDPLTGLANARTFYPGLEREIERSRRSGSPLSLLLLDLDDLKALNDRHGHAAGDRALREIAGRSAESFAWRTVGARLGGDEFGVLAVGASAASGQALAERLRRSIGAEVGKEVGVPVPSRSASSRSTLPAIGRVTLPNRPDEIVCRPSFLSWQRMALVIASREQRHPGGRLHFPTFSCP